MQCKCAIVTNQKPDYEQFYIDYCPMHKAARKMLELLRESQTSIAGDWRGMRDALLNEIKGKK